MREPRHTWNEDSSATLGRERTRAGEEPVRALAVETLRCRIEGLRLRGAELRDHPSLLKLETILEAPKALLHDHLDGGLRPETVIELAADCGYRELPTADPAELARWFTLGADRKSLELYLEGFRHTIALLQTRDAIERVAAECVADLAADNVVYAEVRRRGRRRRCAGPGRLRRRCRGSAARRRCRRGGRRD